MWYDCGYMDSDGGHAARILVTGCAGFIGGNFARRFKERFPGVTIIGIDDYSTGKRSAPNAVDALYEGSVTDGPLLESIFKRHAPEQVFHFAALPSVPYSIAHPVETSSANLHGTVVLLEAARRHGVRRLVFSSSCAVYGAPVRLPVDESAPCAPGSPYAAQKLSGELFCRTYAGMSAMDTVCLRYFNVYGPGQYGDSPYANVIAKWLESMHAGRKPLIEGDGSQTRDFCYVDDVADANILAMLSPEPLGGEAFNIGSGVELSLLDVRRAMESALGVPLDPAYGPGRAGDTMRIRADISKARARLGYEPSVDFETGIRAMAAWFNRQPR